MKRTQKTLTAYKCRICEKYHNEDLLTLIEEKEIKVDLEKLLLEFIHNLQDGKDDENSNRTIILNSSCLNNFEEKLKCIYIASMAGKVGEDFNVVNRKTKLKTSYLGDENAAVYDHRTFCFLKEDKNVFIFYRYGKSGCKTVFQNTFNNFLSTKNLIAHFDIVLSPLIMDDDKNSHMPSKMNLIKTYEKTSSDSAENIQKSKTKTEQELILHLYSPGAKGVLEWLMGKIGKQPKLNELKELLVRENININFDQVLLTVNFGGFTRKINLTEFSGLLAEYDITDKLEYDGDTNVFKIESLCILAKDYAESILRG